jgi:hypothetical protein
MSVIQGEIIKSPELAAGSGRTYIAGQLDIYWQDYSDNYQEIISGYSSGSDRVDWQKVYVNWLEKQGRPVDAAEVLALEFLDFLRQDIDANRQPLSVLSIPAIEYDNDGRSPNQRYRLVNNAFRRHLPEFLAHENGSTERSYGLEACSEIDWNCTQELNYHNLAQIYRPEWADSGRSPLILSCDYLKTYMNGNCQVLSVNYLLTQLADAQS